MNTLIPRSVYPFDSAVGVGRLEDLADRLALEEQWGVDAAILTVLGT